MTTPAPPDTPKKKRGRMIGFGCLGCGGLVLLVVVIMIIATAVSGGGTDETPATTTDPAATSEATTEAEAPSTTENTETTDDVDPQAWADGVATYVITQNAGEGKAWADTCGDGWCNYVTDVSADNTGDLKIALQVAPDAPENEELARATASFIMLSAADEYPDLTWVEVYDSTGVIIDQYQRSDFGK